MDCNVERSPITYFKFTKKGTSTDTSFLVPFNRKEKIIIMEDFFDAVTMPQTEQETYAPQESLSCNTQETPFRLKVKYNHDEMILDEEQARALSQKGLNYDKVKTTLDSLLDEATAQQMEQKFLQSGYATKTEYLNALLNPQPAEIISSRQITSFFERHPQVNASDIPKSVIEDCLEGVPLCTAFESHLKDDTIQTLNCKVEILENELKKTQENIQNVQSSAGAVNGYNVTGSDSIYSEDELNELSGSELKTNLDKAIKSMTFWSKKRKEG